MLKLIFLTLISLTLMSCANSGLFVVNTLALFGEYTVHSDIDYGNNSHQQLDIYLPDKTSSVNENSLATVVFFYGGCWGACNNLAKEDYRFVAQTLTNNNIIAVIVDYRQYPNVLFNDIMSDAKASIEWIHKHIESYGGNKKQLYVMGHSAGAHIASMLSFNENYLNIDTYQDIKGFIGLAGPYDFLPFTEPYQPSLFAPPESYAASQTVNYVDGTEPPALLLYGNEDSRVKRRNIISLAKSIIKMNGRVETHFYDNIDHIGIISALSIPLRSSEPVLHHILQFISANNRS